MPMQITCASCQTRYTLPDAMQGKQVRCKKCGQSFLATPAPAAPAPRASKLPTKPKAPASPEPVAPAPARKSGGGVIALVAVLLLAVAGAGGAWFFVWGPGAKNRDVAQRDPVGDVAADLAKDMYKDMGKLMPADGSIPKVEDGKAIVPNPDKAEPPVAVPDVSKLVNVGKAPPPPPPPPTAPKSPDALPVATNVKISQQLYDRVQLGMTLEQAESILGKARPIAVNDLPPPLAGPTGAGPDKVRDAGQKCKVVQWYQWGTAELGIFAGFSKLGEGAERATVAAFRSAEKVNGVPVVNYPHKSDANAGPVKMPRPRLNGSYAEMIVGQWHERGHIKYDFRADGTFETKGGPKGTYKFIDNDTFELTPGGKRFLAFYARDEMRFEVLAEALDRENANTVSLLRVLQEQTAVVRALPTFNGETLSLAFMPDGKTLVVGAGTNSANGEQGEIKLFDVATGAEKPFLTKPTHNLLSLGLSADGKTLVTGAFPSVKIWNVETAKEVQTIKSPGSSRVGVTADGKILITEAGGVTLHDVASGNQLHCFKSRYMLYALALAPDGKTAAWRDSTVYVGDLETKKVVFSAKTDSLGGLAFSPDGKVLAMSANQQGVIRLFDVASRKSLALLKGHLGDVRSLAFTPDGRTLVSGGNDCSVRVWDVATGAVRASYFTYDFLVQSVAVSPDGKTVALANNGNKTVRLWDISNIAPPSAPAKPPAATVDAKPMPPAPPAVADAKPPVAPPAARTDSPKSDPLVLKANIKFDTQIYHAYFTADGTILAGRVSEGSVMLWNVADGKLLRSFAERGGGFAVSPDGKLIYTGGAPSKAWDLQKGKPVRSFLYPEKSGVGHIAVSPDGKLLAAGFDKPGDVAIWDTATTKQVRVHKGDDAIVTALAFSPDGKLLAVGSNRPDSSLTVWDPADGKQLAKFKGSEVAAHGLSFSPDSKILAVPQFGENNAIKLFDTSTWKETAPLMGHSEVVLQTVFSPDGATLFAHDRGDVVKAWDLASKREKASVKARGNVLVVSPDGKWLAVGGGVANPPEIQLYSLPLKTSDAKPPTPVTTTDPPKPADPPAKPEMRGADNKFVTLQRYHRILPVTSVLDINAIMGRAPDQTIGGVKIGKTIGVTLIWKENNETIEVTFDIQGKFVRKKTSLLTPPPDPLAKTDPPRPADPATKPEMPGKPTPEDMKPFLGTWTGTAGGFPETWTFKEENGQLVISAIYKRGNNVVGSWTGQDVKVTKGQVTFTEVWEKKPVPTWVSPMPVMVVPDGDLLKYSWGPNYMDGTGMLTRAGPAAPAGDPLVGTWKWFNGGKRTVVADGTLLDNNGTRAGSWKVIDAAKRQYQFTWGDGRYIDDLALSADGQRLDGKNQFGQPVTATREGNNDPLVGTWKWLPGGNRTVVADGTLLSNGRPAGTWKLLDAGQRLYRLTWTFGFVDEVTLSADGKTLEGKNQKGQRVTATREGNTDPLVGTWKWFRDAPVTVAADGTFLRNGKPVGTWKAIDPGKRQYELRWSAPLTSVDELTLSADGKSLDGKNQFGQRVTAAKIAE